MAQAQGHQEQAKLYGRLVAEAWADPAFKQRLLTDPAGVMRERGIEMPAGVQVRVVENTEQLIHLVLPTKPEESGLSDEQLDQLAGGIDPTKHGSSS